MTVHDEVVLECNQEWAEFVRGQCEPIMQGCANMCVPLLSNASIGRDYGEAK